MQICHVWTATVSEVGYVGTLHQPVLHKHAGPKDKKKKYTQNTTTKSM